MRGLPFLASNVSGHAAFCAAPHEPFEPGTLARVGERRQADVQPQGAILSFEEVFDDARSEPPRGSSEEDGGRPDGSSFALKRRTFSSSEEDYSTQTELCFNL